MKRFIVAFLLLLSGTYHALATSTLTCKNQKNTALVSLTIGFAATESIVGVYIEADGNYYSSFEINNAPANIISPIVIAQSYIKSDKIIVELGDENLEKIIATIRLNRAIEGDKQAIAGTLRVNNIGVYSVICSYS